MSFSNKQTNKQINKKQYQIGHRKLFFVCFIIIAFFFFFGNAFYEKFDGKSLIFSNQKVKGVNCQNQKIKDQITTTYIFKRPIVSPALLFLYFRS